MSSPSSSSRCLSTTSHSSSPACSPPHSPSHPLHKHGILQFKSLTAPSSPSASIQCSSIDPTSHISLTSNITAPSSPTNHRNKIERDDR